MDDFLFYENIFIKCETKLFHNMNAIDFGRLMNAIGPWFECSEGTSLFQVSYITWIHSTIPGQIWRQYEGPQMAF